MEKNPTCYHCLRAAFVLALFLLPTIMFAQSLRVIYPNGGESFHADSTVTVRWASSGITDELEIEYTTDGNNWRRIGRTGSSATSISWTVPGRISNTVRVRVITKEEDVSDESDGTFEILENPLDASIVIAPNGGEIWTEGEQQTIRWQLPLDAIDATIELSTNNGTTWSIIGSVPATPASMLWTVPHLSDNDITSAMIRISVTEAADHFDISDAPFTIKPRPVAPVASLRLLLPNGGERLKADSTTWIRWTSENLTGEAMIEYSVNGGMDWSGIGMRDVAAGSIDWKIPDRPTGAALVRIAMRNTTASDRSDAPFTLLPRGTVSAVADMAREGSGASSHVYPNPARDRAAIEWRQNGRAEVTVHLHAADGSVARSVDAGAREPGINSLSIDLDNLPAGTYMYEIKADRVLRGMMVVR